MWPDGNKGDNDRAIQNFDQAIQLDPKDAVAYITRGTAYASKGDNDRRLRTSTGCFSKIRQMQLSILPVAMPTKIRATTTAPSKITIMGSSSIRIFQSPT